ncbi:integrase, catalytic region, zinc finger, CCHC-type containing protein [Tanacetum coccineum]
MLLPRKKAKRLSNNLHLNLSQHLKKTVIKNRLRGIRKYKKNVDTSPRTGNDKNTRQFGNQRTVIVAGNRETIVNQVVQQFRIQCFNCKGFRHFAMECRKPKRVMDYEYHKEKMMLCKQESKDNVDNIKSIVETDSKQSKIDWQNPITRDIKLLVHDMLIPLAHKTLKNVGIFENALKDEMLEDLKYVKFVEKEIDELKMEIDDLKSQLEHEKTDFQKVDDFLLQEFFSRDFLCVILHYLDDIDEYAEMACKYLEKT